MVHVRPGLRRGRGAGCSASSPVSPAAARATSPSARSRSLELLLLAQIVIAIIAPFAGNPPTGSLLEFWVYLISAALLPVAAVFWALLERSRWSTVIMGIAALAVAVMVWRMQVIWTVQVA